LPGYEISRSTISDPYENKQIPFEDHNNKYFFWGWWRRERKMAWPLVKRE
jgi:hypothetical protein